jgi:hypothetical protein
MAHKGHPPAFMVADALTNSARQHTVAPFITMSTIRYLTAKLAQQVSLDWMGSSSNELVISIDR